MNKYSVVGFLAYLTLLAGATLGYINTRPTSLKAAESNQSSNSAAKSDALKRYGMDRVQAEPALKPLERVQARPEKAVYDYVWAASSALYAIGRCRTQPVAGGLHKYADRIGVDSDKLTVAMKAEISAQDNRSYDSAALIPEVTKVMKEFSITMDKLDSEVACEIMLPTLKEEGVVQ